MARSLSNFVNNLSEGIHRIKCKFQHSNKKCEIKRIELELNVECRTKYNYCDCFLEYANFKYDLIEYKCLCCNKNYQNKFDEILKVRPFNIHIF